jgi:hypothetical protein
MAGIAEVSVFGGGCPGEPSAVTVPPEELWPPPRPPVAARSIALASASRNGLASAPASWKVRSTADKPSPADIAITGTA